jgi:thymidylate kinase
MENDLVPWAGQYQTVILEGTDGTGKSTRAKILCEHYGFAVVHSPKSPADVDVFERYRSILRAEGKLVLDRSFLSEVAYGKVLRGHSRLTEGQVLDLTDQVAKRQGIIVYLRASISSIRIRRCDDQWDEVTVRKLQLEYERMLDQLIDCIPIIRLNTDV